MDFNFFRQRVNAIIAFVLWGESTEIYISFSSPFFHILKQMSRRCYIYFVCRVRAFKC